MNSTQTTETRTHLTPLLFMTILVLASMAHVTADMYIPSLPAITKSFGVPDEDVQLSMTFYLIGFGVSHLFYGPLSDRIGRRTPILMGLGLSIIGGLVCLFSQTVFVLIFGRMLQGMGMGSCNSVTRSLSRDLLSGPHLSRVGSHIGMASAFLMAAAPTLGGYIQSYFDWHMSFIILLIYTVVIFILVFKTLPETNKYLNPEATKIKVMLRNYLTLLKSKTFIGFTICAGLAYAGLLAYLTAGPFLLQDVVGLSPIEFGWLAFLVASAIFISALINSRFVVEKGIHFMITCGIYCMITAGAAMLIPALLGYINTYVIMLPVALFAVGSGLTFTNAFAGAFHAFAKMSGIAGALYGCLQILGGACSSAIMAGSESTNQIPLASVFLGLGIASWLSMKFLVGRAQ